MEERLTFYGEVGCVAKGVVGGVGAVPGSHEGPLGAIARPYGWTSVAADLNNRWWTDIFLNFISPANIPSIVRRLPLFYLLSFLVLKL